MLDIKLFREDINVVLRALKNRQATPELLQSAKDVASTDEEWRRIKKEEEDLRAERNKLNNEVIAKKKAGKDIAAEIARSSGVSKRIKEIEGMTEQLEKKRDELMLQLPSIPDPSVPVGKDETQNVEVRKWGKPVKKADDVLSHYEIGNKTDLIDYERGVKLAQHRFTVLRGPLAKLERALINFMLSVQTMQGYTEYAVPYLVNTKTMTGTGQLPKFAEELYKCKEDDLWLIPTAEVPLTNLYAGETIDAAKLPLKLTAFTPCFRREAGAYGKDIRGLIRQHQFDKVELVKLALPESSSEELESLTNDAERILQLLELPYRTIQLCTVTWVLLL
ncbi:MAG: serine--tRNA ligase [Candidatus Micrarchaeota archaeon]